MSEMTRLRSSPSDHDTMVVDLANLSVSAQPLAERQQHHAARGAFFDQFLSAEPGTRLRGASEPSSRQATDKPESSVSPPENKHSGLHRQHSRALHRAQELLSCAVPPIGPLIPHEHLQRSIAPSRAAGLGTLDALERLEQRSTPSDEVLRIELRHGDMLTLLHGWGRQQFSQSALRERLIPLIDFLFVSPLIELTVSNDKSLEELFSFVCQTESRDALLRLHIFLKDRVDPLQHWVHHDAMKGKRLSKMDLLPSIPLRLPVARRSLFFGALADGRLLYFTARQDANWCRREPVYSTVTLGLSPKLGETKPNERGVHARGWLLDAPRSDSYEEQLLRHARKDTEFTQASNPQTSHPRPAAALTVTHRLAAGASSPLGSRLLQLALPRLVKLDANLHIDSVCDEDNDGSTALNFEQSAGPRGTLLRSDVGVMLLTERTRLLPARTGEFVPRHFFKEHGRFSQSITDISHDILPELQRLAPWGSEVAEEMRVAGYYTSL